MLYYKPMKGADMVHDDARRGGERIFIGILIDGEARQRFASWQRQNQEQIGIRWKNPAKFHLTLFFLEHCTPKIRKVITVVAGSVARQIPSFSLTFTSKIGRFRGREHGPDIVFARPQASVTLGRLRSLILRECRRVGISIPMQQRFVPHMTLAKAKQKISLQYFSQPPRFQCLVAQLAVVITQQGPHHDEYRIWKRIPLASKS